MTAQNNFPLYLEQKEAKQLGMPRVCITLIRRDTSHERKPSMMTAERGIRETGGNRW